MAEIKRIIALIKDDEIVEDTHSDSPHNDHSSPPSGNNPPPHPHSSNPLPRTPYPPHNQMVVTPDPEPENTDNQFETDKDYEFYEGSHSDIEFDDDQLIPRKRKDPFSGGAYVAEVCSSSTPDSFSDPKSKVIVNLGDLGEEWRLPLEEVSEIMMEHNATARKDEEKC
ncbi:unnamed protein product [Lactuca saligna]|uniref:Uncharacterized protein n=1 Tax=Lactuca saligna TaxID=75948 RepID=A0AA36E331_LACSI|nr:unnamed protein product [Lactuca saligna]